jgi:hypothetical protein
VRGGELVVVAVLMWQEKRGLLKGKDERMGGGKRGRRAKRRMRLRGGGRDVKGQGERGGRRGEEV